MPPLKVMRAAKFRQLRVSPNVIIASMRFVRIATRRAGIVGELFTFIWSSKRFWLIPMVAVLVLFAVLLVLAQSSAIAPFIYTLF